MKILGFLFFALFAMFPAAQGENTTALLDRALAQISDGNGTSIAFTIVQIDDETAGRIDLQGGKFLLRLPDMQILFDGKTQWTLIESAQEASVSEPDADELAQTSPFLLLQSYKENFDCELTEKKGDITGIVLHPKAASSEIKSVQVMLNEKRNEIVRLTLNQADDTIVEIMLSPYETNQNFPAEHFVFDKEKYPEVEIIDLR